MQHLSRALCSFALALMVGMAMPLVAEPAAGEKLIPTDLYISPNSQGLSIPSGGINIVPGVAATTAVTKTPATVPSDMSNMLGCAGVGQGEFTSGLYNMPETFSKFQQDVDSLLAKQLLTMNYAMPQTAAVFDQLNNFGQQRYASFQQGCSVNALKEDAKNQYLNKCVAELTPGRKSKITENLTGESTPKEPLLTAMATAQAWEICTNQYVSDTTAVALRNDTNRAFAEQVRKLENVTEAIKPLLCDAKSTNSGAGATNNAACWQSLLLPQARLCLDDTLGCDDSNGYLVNEPLLTMPRLFDTFRYIMDDVVIARRVTDFAQQLEKKKIESALQNRAASEAVLRLSNATLGREGDAGGITGTGTSIFGRPVPNPAPDPSVAEFQLQYLNCKDVDILSPLKAYEKQLKAGLGTAATPDSKPLQLGALAQDDYRKVINELALTDADDDQKTALTALAWTSLGCTANQSVPIFDPIITASLQTKCSAPDRYAFYSMAGYDVSSAATRDVYRYLGQRLKQTYARLMTQAAVPAPAAAAGGTPPPAVNSPELNARLARVVKEVMIPYVEGQIARLEELNKTRGQFAQRVQQIYATKNGCVYTGVGTP